MHEFQVAFSKGRKCKLFVIMGSPSFADYFYHSKAVRKREMIDLKVSDFLSVERSVRREVFLDAQ